MSLQRKAETVGSTGARVISYNPMASTQFNAQQLAYEADLQRHALAAQYAQFDMVSSPASC